MTDFTETTPDRLRSTYPERKHVRWDPTINMGHVISAASALIAALTFSVGVYVIINTRVVVLEEAKGYQVQRDLAQDVAVRDLRQDLRSSIEEIKATVNELRRDLKDSARSRNP